MRRTLMMLPVLLAGSGVPAGEQASAGAGARAQERRVVEIVAERFTFTPSRVVVPAGTTLEIRLRSEDTSHGFRIMGGRNVIIPKRRFGEAVVVFEAAEPGEYRFECSRLCGAGHPFMVGEIVVTPDAAAQDGGGEAASAGAGAGAGVER